MLASWLDCWKSQFHGEILPKQCLGETSDILFTLPAADAVNRLTYLDIALHGLPPYFWALPSEHQHGQLAGVRLIERTGSGGMAEAGPPEPGIPSQNGSILGRNDDPSATRPRAPQRCANSWLLQF